MIQRFIAEFRVRLLLLLLIAALPFAAGEALRLNSDLIFFLTLPLIVTIPLVAANPRGRSGLGFFAAANALVTFGFVFLYVYYQITLVDFSSQLALESWRDSLRTVGSFPAAFVGIRLSVGLLLGFLTGVASWWSFRCLDDRLSARPASRREARLVTLILLIIGIVYVRASARAFENIRVSRDVLSLRRSSVGDPPDPSSFHGESVLILQLESFNAKTAFAARGSEFSWVQKLPAFDRIWREGRGVLFPFFWANGSATNRALESIACGISGNLSLTRDPEGSFGRCLGWDLARAGYQTRAYHSSLDAQFYFWDQILPAMGFKDVRAGVDLMDAKAARGAMAYDDCDFYAAAHRVLQKKPAGASLTYLEVSMNHAPFDASPRHPASWAFPKPDGAHESYVNSLLEQDHCLGNFWEDVQARGRENLHVFILGDHSIPTATTMDLEDRFFTPMLYLPPPGRSTTPRAVVSDAPPAQADLHPTILELLTHRPRAGSFAAVLRGESYDPGPRCQTLVNVHGLVAHARRDRRAYFTMTDGTGQVSERGGDGAWRSIGRVETLTALERDYGCEQ